MITWQVQKISFRHDAKKTVEEITGTHAPSPTDIRPEIGPSHHGSVKVHKNLAGLEQVHAVISEGIRNGGGGRFRQAGVGKEGGGMDHAGHDCGAAKSKKLLATHKKDGLVSN